MYRLTVINDWLDMGGRSKCVEYDFLGRITMNNESILNQHIYKENLKERSIDAIKGIETDRIVSMELDDDYSDSDFKYLVVTVQYN